MNARPAVLALALVLAGPAHAQEAGLTALLDNPLLKALGVKDPVPATGVYKAKAGAIDVWLHDKTSDRSWVAVLALPSSPNALALLTKQLTLTSPVLVIASTAASSNLTDLPDALKSSLSPVAVNGTVSWLVGANLISKADANTPDAKKLKDPKIGLLPTGGLLLTGTLGAAILEQLGSGTLAAPSADWSMNLTMRTTSEWKPANSPISSKVVIFGLTRAATGGSTGEVTFDAKLEGLTLNWPGYTTPSNAWAAVSWSTTPGGDFSVSGTFNNVFPQFQVSAVNLKRLGFFYAVRGLEQDMGLSLQLETKLPGGTPPQLFSGAAHFNTAQGSLTFAVKLDSDWARPFNLDGTTLLKDTGLDFTIATVTPSLGFGMTGNLKLLEQTYKTTFCADLTAAGLKAVGLSFEGSTLSVATQMQLVSGLMRSIAPSNQTAAFATWKADLDKLSLPEFTGAKVVLYTPGLTCVQPAFAGKPGFGATLDGNMSFLGNPMGSAKNTFALNGDASDGLFIDNRLNAFKFPNSVLTLGNAQFKVNAPLSLTAAPGAAVAISGSASGGVLNGLGLEVKLGAKEALFDVAAAVQGLGSVKFNAKSVGPSLAAMNDFRLSASLETDPNLKGNVTNALKPVLKDSAAARKQAVNAGYSKIVDAQRRFDTIDARVGGTLKRLSDAAAALVDGVGRCLSQSFDACLKAQKALEDFKAGEDYGKWLVAKTQLEWAKSTYATEKATFELWDGIEKEMAKAASSVSVSSAKLDGSLASGKLTLALDATLLGKPAKGSFTLNLGTAGVFGSPAENSAFAAAIEASSLGNAPKPAVLWGTGPTTSTTIKTQLVDGRLVVSAKVFMPEGFVLCGGGDRTKERPTGEVSLYLRRPGQPAIDRASAIAIATAKVNERGGCQTDVVKFNAQESSCSDGAGCCDQRPQGYDLGRERGTFFLSAGYNGGPTPCSSASDPQSGFRHSLSDEVMVVVGRADDTGEVNPGESKWGEWRSEATCPAGTWARSYGQRVEPKNAKGDDDSALNSVRLMCAKPDGSSASTIKSHDGWWGSWADAPNGCAPGTFINAVRIRLEPPQGGKKDDTAANDVSFRCSNGAELSAGNGTTWGDWTAYKECPAGSAVCGLSIKLQDKQGGKAKEDDSAMNGLRLRCCAL